MKTIKQLIRELLRNKLFFFLNLLIVSVTIAVVMLFAMRLENDLGVKAPEVHFDKTLVMWHINFSTGKNSGCGSALNLSFFNDYLLKMKSPELISVFCKTSWTFLCQTETESYLGNMVDASYFLLHEFKFLDGKPILEEQFRMQEDVMVISRRMRDEFFENEKVVGDYLEYNGKNYRVVGVVENVPISCKYAYGEFWIPRSYTVDYKGEFCGRYTGLFKASNSKNVKQIKDEVKGIVDKINGNFTKGEHIETFGPELLFDQFHIDFSDPKKYKGRLWIWSKITGQFLMLMFVPIIGLISLNLVYVQERAEEMAIRKTFGANRSMLIRQMLTENILQTFAGGLLGLGLSILVVHIAPNLAFGTHIEYYTNMLYVVFNFKVFLIAFLIVLLFGAISGFIPALRISSIEPATILKGGRI